MHKAAKKIQYFISKEIFWSKLSQTWNFGKEPGSNKLKPYSKAENGVRKRGEVGPSGHTHKKLEVGPALTL